MKFSQIIWLKMQTKKTKKNEGVAVGRIPYFVDFVAFWQLCNNCLAGCLIDWLVGLNYYLVKKKKFPPYGGSIA